MLAMTGALALAPFAARGATPERRDEGRLETVDPTEQALRSYTTWLHYEHRVLCRLLHPELSWDADRFVHLDCDGGMFHSNENFSLDAAYDRAARIIPLVGLDPREVAR